MRDLVKKYIENKRRASGTLVPVPRENLTVEEGQTAEGHPLLNFQERPPVPSINMNPFGGHLPVSAFAPPAQPQSLLPPDVAHADYGLNALNQFNKGNDFDPQRLDDPRSTDAMRKPVGGRRQSLPSPSLSDLDLGGLDALNAFNSSPRMRPEPRANDAMRKPFEEEVTSELEELPEQIAEPTEPISEEKSPPSDPLLELPSSRDPASSRPDYLIPNLLKALSNVQRGADKPVDSGLADDINKQTMFDEGLRDKERSRQDQIRKFIMQRMMQRDDKALDRSQRFQDAKELLKLKQDLKKDSGEFVPFAEKNRIIGDRQKETAKYKYDLGSRQREEGTQKAASQILRNPVIQNERTKLDAVRSAKGLLDEVMRGELVDTDRVSRTITNLITNIESIGRQMTQSERDHSGISTVVGSWESFMGKVSNKPTSVQLQNFLPQLKKEVEAMGKRIAQNYSNSIYSIAERMGKTPELQDAILTEGRAVLRRSGYDDRDQGIQTNAPTPSASPALSSDIVRVQSPDGKIYKVPKERLNDAISAGGKVIQ